MNARTFSCGRERVVVAPVREDLATCVRVDDVEVAEDDAAAELVGRRVDRRIDRELLNGGGRGRVDPALTAATGDERR